MNDDQRKTLELVAQAADNAAEQHHPGCGTAKLMRVIGDAARGALGTAKGPAQVATPAYRDNWETLFGKKQTVGQA